MFDPDEVIANLPHLPGVYRMLGANGDALYVGKAGDLRKRVSSYFQKQSGLSPRIRLMLGQVHALETTVTRSEAEALLLENNLIKQYQPRYNVLLRDDKSYPYVKLTWKEAFPKVFVTRKVRKDGGLYYGPFFPASTAYRAAELVPDRAFPTATSEVRTVRKTAADIHYDGGKKQKEALSRFGIKRPLRFLLYPGNVQTALSSNWFGKVGPEHSGLYRMRLQASGIRPLGGQTAHLSIGKRTGEETVDGLIEFDLTAPEDQPQVYEFEVFLEMPMSLDFCVVATDVVDRRQGAAFRNALGSGAHIFTHSSETQLLNPNAPQMFDDKGNGLFSTVLLDWIEWEGPLETDVEKSRRSGLLPPDDAKIEVVAEHLHRLAVHRFEQPCEVAAARPRAQQHHAEPP